MKQRRLFGIEYTLFYIKISKPEPEAQLFLMSTLIVTKVMKVGFFVSVKKMISRFFCFIPFIGLRYSRNVWPKIEAGCSL